MAILVSALAILLASAAASSIPSRVENVHIESHCDLPSTSSEPNTTLEYYDDAYKTAQAPAKLPGLWLLPRALRLDKRQFSCGTNTCQTGQGCCEDFGYCCTYGVGSSCYSDGCCAVNSPIGCGSSCCYTYQICNSNTQCVAATYVP